MGIKTNTENCWQYEIRVANRDEDLKKANLSENDVKDL